MISPRGLSQEDKDFLVGCRGASCQQGRQPCRERCGEMAVWEPKETKTTAQLYREFLRDLLSDFRAR